MAPDAPAGGDLLARYKQQAAERAVELVQSGMVVGLGTGSTAAYATRRIGRLLAEGSLRDLVGVPTSEAIARTAHELGIPLTDNDLLRPVDLTIDGADEVDPAMDLIKGAGGALLREKIVAQASRRVVIVVDETKLVPRLGSRSKLPVEVLPFGWRSQADFLEGLGAQVRVREVEGGGAFETDSGNLILDCTFRPIPDAAGLSAALKARAGVVEHGLFVGLATDVIVAGADGIAHHVRGDRRDGE
jgi:ribose 5-phosphate isomerase A